MPRTQRGASSYLRASLINRSEHNHKTTKQYNIINKMPCRLGGIRTAENESRNQGNLRAMSNILIIIGVLRDTCVGEIRAAACVRGSVSGHAAGRIVTNDGGIMYHRQ